VRPRALLIDLDGVLCVEDEAITGARNAVERLRAQGLALRFVTNTTARRARTRSRSSRASGWRSPTRTSSPYLGLGSGQGVRYFEVDLDRAVPTARYVGGSGAGATKRDPLPLRVTRSDVEVIDLLANTLHCDCEWVAQLGLGGGDAHR
jgi:hypothetical protein